MVGRLGWASRVGSAGKGTAARVARIVSAHRVADEITGMLRESLVSRDVLAWRRRDVFEQHLASHSQLSVTSQISIMSIRYWVGLLLVMVVALVDVGALAQAPQQDAVDIFQVTINPTTAKISSTPKLISQSFPGRSVYPRFFSQGTMLSYVVSPLGYPIVVRPYPDGQDQIVPLDFDRTAGMTWTPDDNLIVLGVPKGATVLGFYRVDKNTGKSTLILSSNAPGGRVNGRSAIGIPEFGRDGTMFYRDDWRHAVIARALENGTERVIYQQPGPEHPIVRGVHPSPDGKWVSFVEHNDESGVDSLKVVGMSNGVSRELASARRPDVISLTPGAVWMNDSRRVLFVRGRESRLELWDVAIDGGNPQPTGLAMEGLSNPFLNPDGKTLVFAAGPGYPRN
jgi:hypothetical protein